MINTKRPNTDDYTQVGFIEAKDNQGNYQNIDHIYDSEGNIVFQQGYLNEYDGANDFRIPAIGKPLIDYTIYGNTFQDGIPTPDNSIMPEGTGERTGNLFDISVVRKEGTRNYYLAEDGTETSSVGWYITQYIPVSGENVTISGPAGINPSICAYDENKQYLRGKKYNGSNTTISIQGARYVRFSLVPTSEPHQKAMLNYGTTVLPYEPYGYKIPISSANTTTNIYLGEVETTRKIKQLVLKGNEDITYTSGNAPYRLPLSDIIQVSNRQIVLFACSHYEAVSNSASWAQYNSCVSCSFSGGSNIKALLFRDTSCANVDAFKTYLAQQYANGTPVTIWYVLATETTGIVNEPLMRIGDYADTLSMEQAGVEIPTLKRPNTTEIDIATSLPPSEVDVIYRATYRPSYQLFLAANGDSFEAKDGQSLYIGKDEKTTIYGWRVDPNISNSSDAVTYLNDAVGMTPAHMGTSEFNYGSWENAFFMPKPCMVNYDGTVAYYLDPNDYSKRTDGRPSDVDNPNFPGNAMMQWPLIWYKFEGGTEDGEGYFYVANRQVDSTYHCWCNVDSKNNIIPHFYTAIYNSTSFSNYSATTTYAVGDTAIYDGKLYKCITAISEAEAFDSSKWEVWSDVAPDINKFHSMSGLHLTKNNGASNTNGATEVTRSTANNTTSDVEWYTEVFSDRLLINALLVLMGKSINTQAVFGRGLDSGGETVKNNYVTGSLNDKGLFWGVTNAGTSGVKVFGMENYWACLWRRTAGCVGVSGNYKIKLTYGTADGTTVEGYNSNGNGYLDSGVIPATGYAKTFRYSENGFVPDITTGGSNSTYYGDYFYKGNGYLLVGGGSDGGAICGAFCFDLGGGFSSSYWSVSAALSCKPVRKG